MKDTRSSVNSVAFSPDGSRLASGSWDETIRLWNATTGKLMATLRGHTNDVNSVAFSPDGSRLASGSTDGTIRLWDVATVNQLHKLTGHGGDGWNDVTSVAFSPDGSTIASGSRDNTIKLWDVATGDELRTLTGHRNWVTSVAFSPDGTLLASGSENYENDGAIRLWDVATGKRRSVFGYTDDVDSVAFSPDGTILASDSRSQYGEIVLWYLGTSKRGTVLGHTDDVYSVAFSPDGAMLASGSRDETIRLWGAATGAHMATLEGHTAYVLSVAFSPDGQALASGSGDGTIRLWEISPYASVSLTTLQEKDVPSIRDQLTLNINITDSENVTGYQAMVRFDTTALRYVESSNGDYLPDDSFFVDPVVDGGMVILGATSVNDSSSGDGVLATLTFEFIGIKKSTITLSEFAIVDNVGDHLIRIFQNREVTVGVPQLREDVNLDGVVDILDLQLVASGFGKPRQTIILRDTVVVSGDVNGDGDVDIVDLVLVAGALGNKAAAPALYPQARELFTAAAVQNWLIRAQQLNLTDPTSRQGISFLETLLTVLTPKKTRLLANYPNPFNPETWIPYQLAKAADVTLTIYAVDGTMVRTLALGHQPIGIYQGKSRAAYWDGKNKVGEPVASGVYFYTLTTGDFTATRKMLIRK